MSSAASSSRSRMSFSRNDQVVDMNTNSSNTTYSQQRKSSFVSIRKDSIHSLQSTQSSLQGQRIKSGKSFANQPYFDKELSDVKNINRSLFQNCIELQYYFNNFNKI
jgi:hypothetical protein